MSKNPAESINEVHLLGRNQVLRRRVFNISPIQVLNSVARPCLASKIRWDRARLQGGMDIDSTSISNRTFSLLGNSNVRLGIVLAPSLIQRYGNDLDVYETHAMCQVLCVTTRGNCGGGKEKRKLLDLKVKPFLWAHFAVKSAKSNHPKHMIATMESVCCLSEPSTSDALSFWILTTTLSHQAAFYCSHYTSEETEAWKVSITVNIPQLVSGEHVAINCIW